MRSVRRCGWLVLVLVWGQGCSPRYFQADTVTSVLQGHYPSLPEDLKEYEAHYAMTLRQRRFFKNNIEETVLITDHSRLVRSGRLFFSEEEGNPRGRRWHRVDAWLKTTAGGAPSVPAVDQPVVLASSKGRLDPLGGKEFELILVYTGKVLGMAQDTDRQGRPLWRVRLDRAWQITGKGETHHLQPRDKAPVDLEVLLSYAPPGPDPEHLEVYTLIDRGQNQIGVEKALIFDFRQIYGEPLWLLRNQ